MNRYYKITLISLSAAVMLIGHKFFFKKNAAEKKESSVAQVDLKLPRHPYQDIIINNKIVKRGRGPRCESRYQAIKKILAQFKRPITVLDIGAAEGYMSLRIANDFDATCVMIEHPSGESGGFLKQLCELNTDRDNLILLYKKITADELKLLSECEHFDVVIALNVLHHFPEDKMLTAANAVLALGDYAIVETPPINDTGSCGKPTLPGINKFIKEHDGKVIARTSRRHTRPDLFANTYFLRGQKKGLKRRGLIEFNSPGYEIYSNPQERFLVKKSEVDIFKGNQGLQDLYKVSWPKGISYLTFKFLNGVYPTKDMIKKSIVNIKKAGESIIPQHLVMQGKNLVSIADTKNIQISDDMLQSVFNLVDEANAKKVAVLLRDVYQKIHV